jgi:hypothetical protein
MFTTFLLSWCNSTSGRRPPLYRGFTITLRHTTLSRTPLDEWSACRRDLYLTTHNTHKRQTSMPPTLFEPTISAAERPQTHSLGSAATGTGLFTTSVKKITRGYMCTVTSGSCIRYQRSTPQPENPLRVFWGFSVLHLLEFSCGNYDPPWLAHHSFAAKNIPNLASYGMLSRVGLRKYVYITQWTAASRLQVSSGSILTYLLTPWSRVLLEKLTGSAASQEIPRIFVTRKFITLLTNARHLSLSWANSIQSPQPPRTSWRSISVLSPHLHLGLPHRSTVSVNCYRNILCSSEAVTCRITCSQNFCNSFDVVLTVHRR